MRTPRPSTIRGRLVIACVLLVLAPLAAAWGLGWYDALDIRAEAAALTRLSARLQSVQDDSALENVAASEHVYIRRLDAQGRVVMETEPGDGVDPELDGWLRFIADSFFGPGGAPTLEEVERSSGPLAERREVVEALAGSPSDALRRSASGGLMVSYRVVPFENGALVLARGQRRSARSLYDSRYQLLKLSLALCFGAVLVGAWLAYTVVSPIALLRRRIAIHRRTGSGGTLRLPRNDEIGELASDFEALRKMSADRLADTTRAAADLAHELKSPVAAVSAAAELVRDTDVMTGERRDRIANALAEASLRMSRTVDSVLALAELEESLFATARTQVDVGVLSTSVVEQVDPGQRAMGIEVCDDGALVLAVPDRLREALRLIVDNALVFARDRVDVVVDTDATRVTVSVVDDGPGVAADERDRIFARFYSSRPANAPKGTGLGLPIARSIAAALGGELTLAPARSNEGARFVLVLPRLEV